MVPAALGFAVPVMTVLACESANFSLICSAKADLLASLAMSSVNPSAAVVAIPVMLSVIINLYVSEDANSRLTTVCAGAVPLAAAPPTALDAEVEVELSSEVPEPTPNTLAFMLPMFNPIV